MTNGATIVASRFAVGDNGGTGSATIDNSTVNLDGVVFNNGLDQGPIGAGVRIGRGVGANGLLTMQNGAVININNTDRRLQRHPGRHQRARRAGPAR